MASNDETFQLVMKTVGEDKVAKLKADLALTETQLQRVVAAMGNVDAASLKASAKVQNLTGDMTRLRSELAAAEAGLKSLGRAAGRSGQGLLNFSRVADDAQYVFQNGQGLRPIINNMMEIAPAAGIALLAIDLLSRHWEKLADALGAGHVKTAAEEMEELRKKTSLTADEAERLNRADAVKHKVGELRNFRTKGQKTEEEAVTEAIGNAGFKDVTAGILKHAPGLLKGLSPELDKAREDLAKEQENLEFARQSAVNDTTGAAHLAIPGMETRVKDAKERVGQEAENLAASPSLPKFFAANREKIANLVAANPLDFTGGAGDRKVNPGDQLKGARLADDLLGADAGKMAREKMSEGLAKVWEKFREAVPKAAEKEQKELDVEQKKKKAADDKLTTMLTKEGDEGERLWKKEQRAEEMKAGWGRDDEIRAKKEELKEAGSGKKGVLSGAAALRDSIQNAVKDPNTEILKNQLKVLEELNKKADRDAQLARLS